MKKFWGGRMLTILALALAAVAPGAQNPLGPPAAGGSDAESAQVDRSAKKAVDYLVGKQHGDGAIVEGNNRYATTMTAFAIMGMLAVGHKPGDPTPQGQALRKALAYLLDPARVDKDGYFGNGDGSRMYGHGIITLTLAETLGMGVDEQQDRTIRERLQRAIAIILRAQAVPKKNPAENGGWRYTPDATDTDLSVTSWHLMALRAAKGAGIDVPKEAIDKAIAYVKNCYYAGADRKGQKQAYFCYQPKSKTMRFGSAAGGLLVLQICGQYDAPEVKEAADYFLTYQIPGLDSAEYVYYGIYYYAQAMHQRGDKYAEHARQVVHDYLIKTQKADGSWPPSKKDNEGGGVYVTSLALLSLSIHYHFLPIYQR